MLGAVKAFYKDSKASIKIDGEKGESFEMGVGVRQGFCDVAVAFQCLHGWCDERAKYENTRRRGRFDAKWKKVEGTNMSIC